MDRNKHVEFESDGQEAVMCWDCITNAANAHDPLEVLGDSGAHEHCEGCGAFGGEVEAIRDRLQDIEHAAEAIRKFAHFYCGGNALPKVERVREVFAEYNSMAYDFTGLIEQISVLEGERDG